MIIKAGDLEIPASDLFGDIDAFEGKTRNTLRVVTEAPLTREQMEALLSNDWHLLENGPEGMREAAVKRGFKRLKNYQLLFVQTETPEEREEALLQRIAELEATAETATQELTALRAVLPIDESKTTLDIMKGESL